MDETTILPFLFLNPLSKTQLLLSVAHEVKNISFVDAPRRFAITALAFSISFFTDRA